MFFLREAFHGHDVEHPASPLAQLGKSAHQTLVVIGNEVSPNALTGYVRDDDLLDAARARRSARRTLISARADVERALRHARKAQHVDAHRVPPATLEEAGAAGALDDALDGLGGRALRALAALGSSERGAAVGEEDGVEPPRAPAALARVKRRGGHAVHPVRSRLDRKRRPRRAKEEEVHPGPVAPFLGRGVREDEALYGGYGSVGRRTSVGSVPKRPCAKDELGAKVVVMSEDCFFFFSSVRMGKKRADKRRQKLTLSGIVEEPLIEVRCEIMWIEVLDVLLYRRQGKSYWVLLLIGLLPNAGVPLLD